MTNFQYRTLVTFMLCAVCTGALSQLHHAGSIPEGVMNASLLILLIVAVVVTLVSYLLGSPATRWGQRRHASAAKVQQEAASRRYLEANHQKAAPAEVLNAAKVLATREGILAEYQTRLARVSEAKDGALTLGDVWLALENSRVAVGVKRNMDDNAVTRLSQGQLEA